MTIHTANVGTDVKAYYVYVKKRQDNWSVEPSLTLGPSPTVQDITATIDGLTNDTEYTIGVTAANGAGTSDINAVGATAHATPTASVTTTTTAHFINIPDKAKIEILGVGDKSFDYKITPPEDTGNGVIDYYTIDFTETGNPNYAHQQVTDLAGTVTGPRNGFELTIDVRAHNSAGDGPASDNVTATPKAPDMTTTTVKPAVPGKPALEITGVGDTSFDYKITPPAEAGTSAITYYTINYTETGNPSYAHQQSIELTGTVKGPRNGHELTIDVTAHNSVGDSVASDSVKATPVAPTTTTTTAKPEETTTTTTAKPAETTTTTKNQ